jgi:hypothetical protein
MAEMGIGSGRVLGVAFSLQDAGATRDPGRFMRNALGYLLGASRAGTAAP